MTGTKVKSVGKDISDSLGGAIYNAVLSVDINELDYMENATLTDSNVTLNLGANKADQYFGFSTNTLNGSVQIMQSEEEDYEEQLSYDIQREIKNTQNILHKIKSDSPKTNLSDQELIDMYSNMNNDGFLIF